MRLLKVLVLKKNYLEHLKELDTLTKIKVRSRIEERKAEREEDYDQTIGYDLLRMDD